MAQSLHTLAEHCAAYQELFFSGAAASMQYINTPEGQKWLADAEENAESKRAWRQTREEEWRHRFDLHPPPALYGGN